MQVLSILFFFVALLYATVGFGGGSSYLAILSLVQDDVNSLRTTALLCNIVVVSGNLVHFHRAKWLPWRKAMPLVLASVPFAFLGARMRLSDQAFFTFLGVLLVIAGVAVLLKRTPKNGDENDNADEANKEPKKQSKATLITASTLGAGIGLASGIAGIGGGVFLSPFLHLRQWDLPKRIAATASLFIFANSIAGLLGLYTRPDFQINWTECLPLVIAVFIGGQLGAWLSAEKFSQNLVRIFTALLTIYVGIGLLGKWVLSM